MVSKTERALEDLEVDALTDREPADPPDSTDEIMAGVDAALDEYVASVEEYAGREPSDIAEGNGNGTAVDETGTHGRSGNGVAGDQGDGSPVGAPTADDDGFFVLPEVISRTDQVPIIDATRPAPPNSHGTPRRAHGVPSPDGIVRHTEPVDVVTADVPASGTPPHAPESLVAPDRTTPVSDDILEELRQADVDGPTVEALPQDDTTSGIRRPRRQAEYDPAPIPIPAKPPRLLGRKPRVRKVTRVLRHVDPWSVFKIALVANLVLYVVLMTAGVLLWNVAYATGTVDNVERFFESFGWSSFEFNGGQIYHSAWIAGLFAVIGLTGLAVLLATLFNLITDLVGGIRLTVLEEEVVERRTSPMRRFVVRRPEPEVPAVIVDASGPMVREAVVDDSGAIERRVR